MCVHNKLKMNLRWAQGGSGCMVGQIMLCVDNGLYSHLESTLCKSIRAVCVCKGFFPSDEVFVFVSAFEVSSGQDICSRVFHRTWWMFCVLFAPVLCSILLWRFIRQCCVVRMLLQLAIFSVLMCNKWYINVKLLWKTGSFPDLYAICQQRYFYTYDALLRSS